MNGCSGDKEMTDKFYEKTLATERKYTGNLKV